MDTEKSEITNLPEGMSSEELDALTTGEEVEQTEDTGLAKEALDATEESSPAEESVEDESKTEEETSEEKKPDADPKDAVIGDFRRKLRDEEIKTARLESELTVRKELQTTAAEPEKSPLELAEAAYVKENGDIEGFAISPSLYRQQRTFEVTEAASKAATEKSEHAGTDLERAAQELQDGDFSPEKMGKGLDLQTVFNMADTLLTRGDRVDIADVQQTRGTAAALKEAYRIGKTRILAAGGEDAKVLQNAINTSKSKSQTKPKKTKTDIDALTTEGEDTKTGEAETETHNSRLTDFIFTP